MKIPPTGSGPQARRGPPGGPGAPLRSSYRPLDRALELGPSLPTLGPFPSVATSPCEDSAALTPPGCGGSPGGAPEGSLHVPWRPGRALVLFGHSLHPGSFPPPLATSPCKDSGIPGLRGPEIHWRGARLRPRPLFLLSPLERSNDAGGAPPRPHPEISFKYTQFHFPTSGKPIGF